MIGKQKKQNKKLANKTKSNKSKQRRIKTIPFEKMVFLLQEICRRLKGLDSRRKL